MDEPPRMRRRVVTTTTEPTGTAGNAPDMMAQEPVRVIQIGSYTAVLVRNPPSMLARHGQRSSIRFRLALGVFQGHRFAADPDSPVVIVTLEQTPGQARPEAQREGLRLLQARLGPANPPSGPA